jgi:hypothetical protein
MQPQEKQIGDEMLKYEVKKVNIAKEAEVTALQAWAQKVGDIWFRRVTFEEATDLLTIQILYVEK